MADHEQNNRLDRLTSQLSELPSIIGRLGISVASAQKALNAEYVTSLQEIMKILNQSAAERTKALGAEIAEAEKTAAAASKAFADAPAGKEKEEKKLVSEEASARLQTLRKELGTPLPAEVVNLIKALAPSRYQFSETTLDFSADLSQTLNVGAGLSLGVGTPAVTVSASFSLAYGFDYRAAARIKTILHALPEPDLCKTLLDRAEAMDATKLTLQPKDTAYSQHMIDGLKDIAAAIKASPPAPASKPQGS